MKSDAGEVTDVSSSSSRCAICLENLAASNMSAQPACLHTLCLNCAAQNFVIHSNNFCPTCREKPDKIVVTRHGVKSDNDWKEITNYNICDSNKFFFFDSHPALDLFNEMFSIYCYLCKQAHSSKSSKWQTKYSQFSDLVKHMKVSHGMIYCDVCIDNFKTFPSLRRVYKPKNIKLHKLRGDFTAGFGLVKIDRHHLCKFCNIWFFDIDSLYKHCRKEHLFCTICEEATLDFYEDFEELCRHFKSDHFVCYNPDCAEDHYINVFKTQKELAQHLKENHGINLRVSKNSAKANKRKVSLINDVNGNGIQDDNEKKNINFRHSSKVNLKKNASKSKIDAKNNRASNFTNHEAVLEGTLASAIDEQIEIANLQSRFRDSENFLLAEEEFPSLDITNAPTISKFKSSGYSVKAITQMQSTSFNTSTKSINSKNSNWVKGNGIAESDLFKTQKWSKDTVSQKNQRMIQPKSDHQLAQQLNWSLNVSQATDQIRINQNTKQIFPKSQIEQNEADVIRKLKGLKKLAERSKIKKNNPDVPPGLEDLFQN